MNNVLGTHKPSPFDPMPMNFGVFIISLPFRNLACVLLNFMKTLSY